MLDLMWINRGTLLFVAMLAVGAASLKYGGAPERLLAASVLAAMVLDRFYHLAASGGATVWSFSDYSRVDVGHLVLDSALLLSMAAIALTANRVYPIWIAGLQIVTLLTHFGRASAAEIQPLAYAIMTYAPFYLQLILMVAGLVFHTRRRKRRGEYRDWRLRNLKPT